MTTVIRSALLSLALLWPGTILADGDRPAAADLGHYRLSTMPGSTTVSVTLNAKAAGDDAIGPASRTYSIGFIGWKIDTRKPWVIANLRSRRGHDENKPAVSILFENGRRVSVTPVAGRGLSFYAGDAVLGMVVKAPLAWGVLPSRHLDDAIYNAKAFPDTDTLALPNENLVAGLIEGGDAVLALGWPPEAVRDSPELLLTGRGDDRHIEGLRLRVGVDRAIHVALLTAPGIWHRVPDGAIEPDVERTIDWRPPFDAAWTMRFAEQEVPTTWHLESSARDRRRPSLAAVPAPFYKKGNTIVIRLPRGKLQPAPPHLIYAVQGHAKTPFNFLAASLTPEQRKRVAELGGIEGTATLVKDMPHWVFHAACGGLAKMKRTVLPPGSQARAPEFFESYATDKALRALIAERQNARYEAFLNSMRQWMEAPHAPRFTDLAQRRDHFDYLANLYRTRMDNKPARWHIDHIERLRRRLAELAREPGEEVYPELYATMKAMNNSLSRQEQMGHRFGNRARLWFQQAALDAADKNAQAARDAREIRRRIRDLLTVRRWETPPVPKDNMR